MTKPSRSFKFTCAHVRGRLSSKSPWHIQPGKAAFRKAGQAAQDQNEERTHVELATWEESWNVCLRPHMHAFSCACQGTLP